MMHWKAKVVHWQAKVVRGVGTESDAQCGQGLDPKALVTWYAMEEKVARYQRETGYEV